MMMTGSLLNARAPAQPQALVVPGRRYLAAPSRLRPPSLLIVHAGSWETETERGLENLPPVPSLPPSRFPRLPPPPPREADEEPRCAAPVPILADILILCHRTYSPREPPLGPPPSAAEGVRTKRFALGVAAVLAGAYFYSHTPGTTPIQTKDIQATELLDGNFFINDPLYGPTLQGRDTGIMVLPSGDVVLDDVDDRGRPAASVVDNIYLEDAMRIIAAGGGGEPDENGDVVVEVDPAEWDPVALSRQLGDVRRDLAELKAQATRR